MTYDGLIVGLGNPGAKYAKTRHNFGFMLADSLLEMWGRLSSNRCEPVKNKVNAEVWDVSEDYGRKRWLLMKPLTFMNLSGQAVGEICRKTGIDAGRVLILHDELDLALGTVRFKFSGGLAGHNGLKSVAAHLGTKDFNRVRLGIGRPVAEPVVEYVLKNFTSDDWPHVRKTLDMATEAVLDYCSSGIDAATMRLHGR